MAGAGCHADFSDPTRAFGEPVAADAGRHPVVVHTSNELGLLDTDRTDPRGVPLRVACPTCHAPLAAAGTRAGSPHDEVQVHHGELTCGACHAPDQDGLHLADGARFPFREVRRLCTQCHSMQTRDYLRGAHGGMTGYWDLRRGPRQRNDCVDCHLPHAPASGQWTPVMPPRDRFLGAPSGEVHP